MLVLLFVAVHSVDTKEAEGRRDGGEEEGGGGSTKILSRNTHTHKNRFASFVEFCFVQSVVMVCIHGSKGLVESISECKKLDVL